MHGVYLIFDAASVQTYLRPFVVLFLCGIERVEIGNHTVVTRVYWSTIPPLKQAVRPPMHVAIESKLK